MPRLPPADKLSLLDRKGLRDGFEVSKPDLEKQISDLTGEAWTIDIEPKNIAPYLAGTGYEGRVGDVIKGYMEDAIFSLKDFLNRYGDQGKTELNAAVPKHVLSLDVDEADKYSYCGPLVKDGVLYVVFRSDRVWTNTTEGLEADKLIQALSEAGASAGGISAVARANIAMNYEPQVEDVRAAIGKSVGVPDIQLNPNFEQVFGELKAAEGAGVSIRTDWEEALAGATLDYFDTLSYSLRSHKFDADDLLQEAFAEVVDKNEVVIRVVKELKHGSYTQATFEDGRLYIDFKPDTFWTNVQEAGDMLVDRLNEVA